VASLPRFLVKARRGEETRYLLVKPDDASDEAPVDAEADEVGLPR
jgi:hypothetical protein